jgi:hypothetical protein
MDSNTLLEVNVKGKVVPVLFLIEHPAIKAYWGNGGIAPLILDPGTRWRWVVSFMLRPLCPRGKSPWYPLDRRLDGPQSRSGRGGEEKNSQLQPELEPPITQTVAQRYTTELSWLLFVGDTIGKSIVANLLTTLCIF